MGLEIPTEGGGLFDHVHGGFVGGHQHAALAPIESGMEKLQRKDRFPSARLAGDEDRPRLRKSSVEERVESDDARRHSLGLYHVVASLIMGLADLLIRA